jgi:hypothetical protein
MYCPPRYGISGRRHQPSPDGRANVYAFISLPSTPRDRNCTQSTGGSHCPRNTPHNTCCLSRPGNCTPDGRIFDLAFQPWHSPFDSIPYQNGKLPHKVRRMVKCGGTSIPPASDGAPPRRRVGASPCQRYIVGARHASPALSNSPKERAPRLYPDRRSPSASSGHAGFEDVWHPREEFLRRAVSRSPERRDGWFACG